jgi:hypothetical protein
MVIVRRGSKFSRMPSDTWRCMRRLSAITAIIIFLSPCAGLCLSDREVFVLLSKQSKEIKAFPFHVYITPLDYGNFEGTALPLSSYDFFQPVYGVLQYKQPGEVLATYQFSLGTGWKCFLLRVPNMYSTDAIDLWLYDKTRGRWQKPIRIADSWGDAGEEFEIQSWIGDINNDDRPDVLRRTLRTYRDPADPDAKVRILERKNVVFVWEKGHFKNDSRRYLPKIDMRRHRFINKDIQ